MRKLKRLTDIEKAVLERIQHSIPQDWLDNVTTKEQVAPKYAQLIRDIANGVDNPDIKNEMITDSDREKARAVVESGQIAEFEKVVEKENKVITKQIDEYVNGEIEKAMARGELPKGKKFRNLNKKVWKKQNKN
jgi:hypothetical protein